MPFLLILLLPATATAQGIDEDRLLELIEEAARTAKKKNRLQMEPIAKNKTERLAVREITLALDTRKITVNFDKTEFSEALDFLRDVTGLNIVLSKEAEKELSEEEVKLRLKDVKVRSMLNLLLEQVSKDLRYGVKHGVLWIGLKDEWKPVMITRVYYVADITRTPPDFPAPKVGLGENGITFD